MQGQSYTPTCHVPAKTCSGDRDYICPGHIQCIALQQTPSNETFEEILSSKACVNWQATCWLCRQHSAWPEHVNSVLQFFMCCFSIILLVAIYSYATADLWCNCGGVCRLPMTNIASLEQTCCSPEQESGCLLSVSPDWSLWALSWHDTSFPNWRCTYSISLCCIAVINHDQDGSPLCHYIFSTKTFDLKFSCQRYCMQQFEMQAPLDLGVFWWLHHILYMSKVWERIMGIQEAANE
jgi:hypothetical protein